MSEWLLYGKIHDGDYELVWRADSYTDALNQGLLLFGTHTNFFVVGENLNNRTDVNWSQEGF